MIVEGKDELTIKFLRLVELVAMAPHSDTMQEALQNQAVKSIEEFYRKQKKAT
tara:strand:+ start:1375 stop:1533 length:159 start_codon:yes stop_codon:yes gene_type:complete